MAERRLVWKLFPSYLLVTLAGIVGVSIFAATSLRESYLDESRADLRARTVFAAAQFDALMESGIDEAALAETTRRLGIESGTRITVVRRDGVVVADSMNGVASMDNHATRPEVAAALEGSTSESTRYSATTEQEMMYVAAPIRRDGDVVAVVRLAMPTTGFEDAVRELRGRVFFAGALFAGLAALVNWWVSKRLVWPIEQLTEEAKRFARGERQVPLPRHSALELRELSDAMMNMAEELEDRIASALEEKSEREAVLRSMAEGVIAVDLDKRVLNVNRAAWSLLGIEVASAQGRHLAEVVRNSALIQLVEKTLSGEGPLDAEFELHRDTEQFIQARSAMLRRANNEPIGAVVVLNDMTRLKRLEQIRKDFVSNVSHELKTPLTSIKGFVETLSDGAIEDREDARRFLAIIGKHVDRLNAIIEDLLTLSRLEQDEGPAPRSMLEIGPLAPPVKEAAQVCQSAADEKGIAISVECPSDIYVEMNSALMEQCVVNLLDNAIKYSGEGSAVNVRVTRGAAGSASIAVTDRGSGIPSEHLGRLFERFYRVDQARSRNLGGTGLGLSIVRHIVEMHGGTIDVVSTLGKGSTFTITLPTVRTPVAVAH